MNSNAAVAAATDAALLAAARDGDLVGCRRALSRGGKVGVRDERGRTAMHYACEHWQRLCAIAPALLHAGGNIWVEDDAGVSPLDVLLAPDP